MLRILILVICLFPAPALAWGEFGHRTTADIAEANIGGKARAEIRRLFRSEKMLGTPECALKNLSDASVWPDCVRRDRLRWGYTAPWHYQNLNICKAFNLRAACANGNCVSAQIDRNAALLANHDLPDHIRLEALSFLVHFVGDLHMPLHSGSRDDRGANDVKGSYGIIPGVNLHWIWDGYFAERAITSGPSLLRRYSQQERSAHAAGNSADWSLESYNLAKNLIYTRALDGDPCGPKPEMIVWDEADNKASFETGRQQIKRAGLRTARLLEAALR